MTGVAGHRGNQGAGAVAVPARLWQASEPLADGDPVPGVGGESGQEGHQGSPTLGLLRWGRGGRAGLVGQCSIAAFWLGQQPSTT